MTAVELDRFASNYYRNPQPDQITRAIAAMGPSDFTEDRGHVFVGFFATVFAANPDRLEEWQKAIDRLHRPERKLLKEAVKLGHPGAILAQRGHRIALNDTYWGAFFASGDPAYLRRLASEMTLLDEYRAMDFMVGATAKWSLVRNAPAHPLVRSTLEAMAATESDARICQHIDDVLQKDPVIVRQEIVATRHSRNFLDGAFPAGSYWQGRSWSSLAVGAGAGLPPPPSYPNVLPSSRM